ncbi:TPA: helix-hairpin-helix domain-containing protein [Serratia rubidaea]|nr:helix-hairpin-helix domain-containing protein [Serratia rubidaea]HDJ1450092.1 helix-hairpin-helix domain-containing protein [Serratia rubidaea]HDJ1463089.1 helix-hairpin-helix domain-containing protein [Serratia rubidaea]HDJ2774011.1 helix-hairpin-helix domain-containing protein [Serratia rubidaea]
MNVFKRLFSRKNNVKQDVVNKDECISDEIVQAPKHFLNVAAQNRDIISGMEFFATCQLRTPVSVMRKHGEVYTGDGEPPTYGSPRDGIWVPKLLDSSFDFLNEGATAASDAGPVNAAEYIEYAIGLLSIFELNITINERMARALLYSAESESKKRIERGILQFYGESNIADVMSRYISDQERLSYYFSTPGRLTLANGVNKSVAVELQRLGIYTLKDLSKMTESDLCKVKGVGKVSAKKIVENLSGINR